MAFPVEAQTGAALGHFARILACRGITITLLSGGHRGQFSLHSALVSLGPALLQQGQVRRCSCRRFVDELCSTTNRNWLARPHLWERGLLSVRVALRNQGERLSPDINLMRQKNTVIVERIFISPERGVVQVKCERITVKNGMGVLGDRSFGDRDYPGQNLTLVEAEEIEIFCKQHSRASDLSLTRRNLVTRGSRLNGLVNMEFTIGTVRLRGVELCEPCMLLGKNLSSESLAPATVIKRWVGRGGLRADILTDGEIVRGDLIEIDA